jgi:2'-5' RNA ligase
MRLFVSIELPAFVRARISAIQNELKQHSFFEGRFVAPENIHITLAFIGDVQVDQLPQIQAALHEVVFAPFEICTQSLSIHPSLDNAHLLWIDVVSSPLSMFWQTIQQALSDFIKPDKRPFAGHLTVARIKKIIDHQKMQLYLHNTASLNECFMVHEFLLCNSVLSVDGPIYSTLNTYQLRA